MERLRALLGRIDGRGYKAYKELEGRSWSFPGFTLHADHVQGDPFATPSRFRVRIPQEVAGFPAETFANASRAVALRDYLLRAFAAALRRASERRGSGKSGLLAVETPSQAVLERSACQVTADYVELRFLVGLPASGRRILGQEAEELLVEVVPAVVRAALLYRSLDAGALWRHLATAEDVDALRAQLGALGLVAFVADGSILPRRSGVDDRPLEGAVPFRSPKGLRVWVELPNAGAVTGMGIPRGVTLIVGGGFHGKSTLLRALERGVYNHIPGDGRELVVTLPSAVKVRAEDGRSVVGVDISPFIGRLPGGVDTATFTTPNASGSTSQGANIVEALEAGARLLLMDEDTSATNFMVRDRRMQALVAKEHEPITPFVDQVRSLYREHGVSTVLVMGGSGDYLDVADTVIAMVEFRPREVTAPARDVARRFPTGRVAEAPGGFGPLPNRIIEPRGLDPGRGRRHTYVRVHGVQGLTLGRHQIDLSAVEQLVEEGQVRAIGYALAYALDRYLDGRRSMAQILDGVMGDIEARGLDVISPLPYPGDLVRFRPQELAAALNRHRGLRVRVGATQPTAFRPAP